MSNIWCRCGEFKATMKRIQAISDFGGLETAAQTRENYKVPLASSVNKTAFWNFRCVAAAAAAAAAAAGFLSHSFLLTFAHVRRVFFSFLQFVLIKLSSAHRSCSDYSWIPPLDSAQMRAAAAA